MIIKLDEYNQTRINMKNNVAIQYLLKVVFITFCFSLFPFSSIAQPPQSLSYQAIIRDAGGNLLKEQSVGVQISLLQGSDTGNAVYRETHQKPTNANGLVSLEIGKGTVVQGTFSEINWASGPYYIKTETDPLGGSNYTIAGVSPLQSVPYALYALSGGEAGPEGPPGQDGQDGILPDGVDPGAMPYWNGSKWVLTDTHLFYDGQNVAIGTTEPDPLAILDLYSEEKGLLIPRLTTAQRNAMPDPAAGLMIFNTSENCFNYYTGVVWMQFCGSPADIGLGQNQYLPAQGSSFGDFEVMDMAIDHEGNILITGSYYETATFGEFVLESQGIRRVFAVKYNAQHEVLWARTQTASDNEFSDSAGLGIDVDPTGNVFVAGRYEGTIILGTHSLTSINGGIDAFLIKYSPDGDILWVRTGGGNGADLAFDVKTNSEGHIFIAGVFSQTATFGTQTITTPTNNDAFLVKYDPDGNVVWAKNSVGPNNNSARGIAVDSEGNILMTGEFQNTIFFESQTLTSGATYVTNAFTVKYNPDGNVLWLRGGISAGTSNSYSISSDDSRNVFVTGSFLDQITFGSEMITATHPWVNSFLVKYNPDGQVSWVQTNISDGAISILGSEADSAGNLFITGNFSGTLSFGGLSIQTPGGENSTYDMFVAKFNPAGDALWMNRAGGVNSETYGMAVATDSNNEVVVAGSFNQTAMFGSQSLTSNNFYSRDLFLVRYTPSGMVNNSVSSTGVSGNIDLDNDPTNELITSFVLMGTELIVSDSGGDRNVDLTPVATKWSGGGQNIYRTTGNVGIGTFNPGERLHVSGNVLVSGNIHVSGFNHTIFNRTNHSLAFGTNNTERMRINASGTLTIGNAGTGDMVNIHSEDDQNAMRVTVGNTTRFRIYSTGGVGVGSNMQNSPPPAGYLAVSQGVTIGTTDPNNFQLRLSENLAAKPTSNTWTVFSDKRLKKNIQSIDSPLERMLSLRGVTYQWIDPASQGNMDGVYTGFIAQDVEKVFPEWIGEDAKGMKTLTVIGFEGIVVEALRELREEKDAEIKELNDRLETLERVMQQLLLTGSVGEK
jgi:hypothetical protein